MTSLRRSAKYERDRGTDRRLADAFTNQLPAPAWVQPLREAAIARFAELGFPTTHDEEWRFTNVAPIARTTFVPGRTGCGGN